MEKYKTKTTEFSFILKPAKCGVGVFTTHNIKVKTFLRLFGGNENKNCLTLMTRDKKNVPKSFQLYCIDRGKKLICPMILGLWILDGILIIQRRQTPFIAITIIMLYKT